MYGTGGNAQGAHEAQVRPFSLGNAQTAWSSLAFVAVCLCHREGAPTHGLHGRGPNIGVERGLLDTLLTASVKRYRLQPRRAYGKNYLWGRARRKRSFPGPSPSRQDRFDPLSGYTAHILPRRGRLGRRRACAAIAAPSWQPHRREGAPLPGAEPGGAVPGPAPARPPLFRRAPRAAAAAHQDVRCGGGSEQQKQQELVLIPPLPRCFGETGFRLSSRNHDECTRNQLVNHLLKDQEEDPKEAKIRVPLKQLRREQKPLVKSDPEADPENGLNKWFKRSLVRKRLKKRPHKSLQRKTRTPHHAISTSSAVF
ncbi:uncharacterized protein LOC127474681 [Manacus candei]|uniref:uncharacterized protein LOC127474681 n=1 Tax=Manacus candei TaxID=415023 RepID=UPI002227D953|nr:uncharacterized protein LOC127474681 [Manacus candei]